MENLYKHKLYIIVIKMVYFNIIVRTSGRPKYFERCFNSIKFQTHKDVQIFITYDEESDYDSYLDDYCNNDIVKILAEDSNIMIKKL